MKLQLQSTFALLAILTFTGCGGGPDHEEVAGRLMDTMEEFADTVAGVTDETSAKLAAAKLEKIAEKLEALRAEAEALGDPPADVAERINQQMKERQGALNTKMVGMMSTTMSNPKLMEILKPAMEKIGKIMKDTK